MRILVAEDQKELNDIVTEALRKNHYSVDQSYDGQSALDFIAVAEYDALLLDIMMPKKDGFQVLKEIRKEGNKTPVLFFTAKDAIEDRIFGLDLGADDYLIKPFSLGELLARVRVLVRRANDHTTNVHTLSDLTIDLDCFTVKRGEELIALSSKEFALLSYLMQNKGKVLTREQIQEHIWNFDYFGGSNIVDVYIRYLRKKVDSGYEPKLIHTVRGVGYTLKE